MKTLAVVGVIFLIFALGTCSGYNTLVSKDQTVKQELGDLDAAYQRRVDLVPNLAKTVQAAGNFEKSTFVELAAARAAAGQVHISAADLSDPAKMKAFTDAQNGLQSSLTKLLAVAEAYPQLHATEAYRDLMTQLEGTENRIQTERHKVNDAIQDYNGQVLMFPGSLIGRHFGFQAREMFAASEGAKNAPVLDFGAAK